MADIPDVGRARAVLHNDKGSPLDKMLVSIFEDITAQLKQSLVDHNVNTTSLGLSQSIKPTKVSVNGDVAQISIEMAHYWKYVNKGVNGTEVSRGAPRWGKAPRGTKSFHQAILEWIPQRGVSLPERFKTFESFAWAIMANIKKRGQAARPFYDDVVNEELIKEMSGKFSEIIGKSIKVQIRAAWQ